MRKIILTIILIIIYGCESNPPYKEVVINKTIKVFSEGYHNQAENYTFKWMPPIGPNDAKVEFHLKNDMLIFTPTMLGNYQINLSIEDISEKIVGNELFYYKSIPETTKVAIIQTKEQVSPKEENISYVTSKPNKKNNTIDHIEKPISKNTPKKKKYPPSSKRKKKTTLPKMNSYEYAIQISAWPSLEEARRHQLLLIEEGFDAFTQRYYLKKKEEIWYRVRVGNFSDKKRALEIKQQIELLTGISTWLDILTIK